LISRIYLKDCLSFDEVNLEFNKGLNVFTGPSGAGKSILMQAILSLFSLSEVKATLGEVELIDSFVKNEVYDIDKDDDIVIKSIKKEKVRYFLNNQTISKKNLTEFSTNLIKHLNLKDTSDFESVKLLSFLDKLTLKNEPKYEKLKSEFDDSYKEYIDSKKELNKLIEDENKLEDLKEFAKFEIEKIESINPSVDEYDELSELKKRLSKKEKIEESIKKANPIFEYVQSVSNALEVLEEDTTFFDDAINELNNIFEKFNDSLYELEEIDIETVLDRIEKLSALQKRFGSISEALEYKEEKKKELDGYENISFEKSKLEKKVRELETILEPLAEKISKYRKNSASVLETKINHYLKFLYLSNAKIIVKEKKLDASGIDEIEFELNGVNLDTISSGEFNRLRLSLLTSMSEYQIVDNGILFLDEIDANLSGKESEAIAKVLEQLSLSYQIFAISHQPQLTSTAHQHFLVDKNQGKSIVRQLSKDEKINEIARMISGEELTTQALEFAKQILE
jgi:DNA repair protein RecN (Recombination protein N)